MLDARCFDQRAQQEHPVFSHFNPLIDTLKLEIILKNQIIHLYICSMYLLKLYFRKHNNADQNEAF